MSLQVELITPEAVVWSDNPDQVILPGKTGNLGILQDHASLVTVLDVGVVKKRINKKWVPLILFDGFAQVWDNKLIIVVSALEEVSSDLTIQEARENASIAREKLDSLKPSTKKSKELDAAVFDFKLAKARVNALKVLASN